MRLSAFDFLLPDELIAKQQINPRDAARMLVVGQEISNSYIKNLPELITAKDVIIFNDSKVIPAQLHGVSGLAKISVQLHKNLGGGRWLAFTKPARRVKNEIIFAGDFSAQVTEKLQDGEIKLEFNEADFWQKLRQYGQIPLPPYMKRAATESDRTSYQTIYAKNDGSVAAPTAGLHFTEELLEKIHQTGAKTVFLTLHVGAGTFLPVKTEDITEHKMHSEMFEISAATADLINAAKKNGGRIIAVGTTALRVLESVADDDGNIKPTQGATEIFIYPGYKFKIVDCLLTNFHLPKSTLFMLVSAFMGREKMQAAYQHAIKNKYRFFSYGDTSFLIRNAK